MVLNFSIEFLCILFSKAWMEHKTDFKSHQMTPQGAPTLRLRNFTLGCGAHCSQCRVNKEGADGWTNNCGHTWQEPKKANMDSTLNNVSVHTVNGCLWKIVWTHISSMSLQQQPASLIKPIQTNAHNLLISLHTSASKVNHHSWRFSCTHIDTNTDQWEKISAQCSFSAKWRIHNHWKYKMEEEEELIWDTNERIQAAGFNGTHTNQPKH